MYLEKEHVIGILGGMGPEATASLYLKIISATEASKDQDHFHTIIDSNSKIPDRTQAILYGGPSPVDEMIRTAQNLERAGATIMVMPCITAHYFYEEIQASIGIPIFHVLKGVRDYIDTYYPNSKKVGVLSTTATRESGLFQKALKTNRVVFPDDDSQENKVMAAIFGEDGIKQGHTDGRTKELLKEVAGILIEEQGCELIVVGCTEVELALKPEDLSVPFIDPMQIAADYLTKR